MKTLTDLKRDLQLGKELKMTFNSLSGGSETIKNRLNISRKILKTQTNGIYLEIERGSQKGSFLELPVASLVEYEGREMKIYKPGLRKLTKTESDLIKNEPSNRKENRELAERDAISDGSQTYWMDKRYYSENDAKWRWSWYKGLRWDVNKNKMWDKKIKGEIDLIYTLSE